MNLLVPMNCMLGIAKARDFFCLFEDFPFSCRCHCTQFVLLEVSRCRRKISPSVCFCQVVATNGLQSTDVELSICASLSVCLMRSNRVSGGGVIKSAVLDNVGSFAVLFGKACSSLGPMILLELSQVDCQWLGNAGNMRS